MATTTNGYITKLETGQVAKEPTINAAFDRLDAMVGGRLALALTGGTRTLTGTEAAPEAQNLFLDVSGTLTSNATIEIPVSATTGRNRIFVVRNATSGSFTLTVKKVGGTGVTVGQSNTGFLLYNGTDIQHAAPQIVTSTGAIASASISSSPTYTAPSLSNSWVNYGGSAASCGYTLHNGFVKLRGSIKDGTINATVFNLPSGYRPSATLAFAVINIVAGSVAYATIESGGDLKIITGTNTGIALDNITFTPN